jgi:predicted DNA-binding transcriptional regulator AlpA
MDHTLTAPEVAALLKLPSVRALNNRRRRPGFADFPKPLPMRPLRWSAESVIAWIAGKALAARAAPEQPLADQKRPSILRLERRRAA